MFLPRVSMYVCTYYLETVKPAVPLLTTHWYMHTLYYCFQYTSSRATLSTSHIMVKILKINGCRQFFAAIFRIFVHDYQKKYFFSNSFQFSSSVLFQICKQLKKQTTKKNQSTNKKNHWTNLFLYLESARFLSKCQIRHLILFTYRFSNRNQFF